MPLRHSFFPVGAGYLSIVLAVAPVSGAAIWSAGAKTQGVVDFEPGNDYVSGIEAGYSDARLLHNRLEFRVSYLTSRFQAAFDNSLRQDWYLLSPMWHFRRTRFFDPTVQLDFGYQRYDLENEEIFGGYLQNTTWVYGAKAGFNLNFGRDRRYSLSYAFGYQQATSPSSFVYPMPFSLGFSVLFPGKSTWP